jgi:hypothetical protein
MKPLGIRFDVRVQGGEINVALTNFCAIYVKPSDQPQSIHTSCGVRVRVAFLLHYRDHQLVPESHWEPPGVKTVAGPWYSVTQLEGWGVVETESAIALGQLMMLGLI